MRVLSIDMDS